MACRTLTELVSQAEREGVTLAEVIARTMSAKEMDKVQESLAQELSKNYCKIEDFMADISVPSIEEILLLEEPVPLEFVDDEELLLSDEQLLDAQ